MATYKFHIEPPVIGKLTVKKPLLCGPGPADLHPSVQEALSLPVVTHACDQLFDIFDDIRAGLKYAFQTSSDLVLAVSGAGHAGMETVINNLVAPGEVLLIAARGIWDERALTMAERYGIKTVVIRCPPNSTFSMRELELALKQHRPAALFIVHGDSSTGTVQQLSGLGEICHRHGAMLLVDTVVSLGGVPFLMDAWGVDAVYTSTQKALSGPAGISPVAFSARAENKIKNRKHQPVFYFDVELLAKQWNCYGNTRVYHHTMSPPLLFALHACLAELSRETLPVSWARHANATRVFHEGLTRLPVKFYVTKPADRLDTVTTIELPAGYDYAQFCKFIRERHNILIFGGLGPTAGKTLRVGIMGVNATERVSEALLVAMEDALVKLKRSSL